MEFIKAKSSLITLALLLAFAAPFFSLAAARRPHPSAAVDFSVLKLPTEANNTAIEAEEEEICCDDCGFCQPLFPPKCSCEDVRKECPSWCEECEDVEGGKMCVKFIFRYCDKQCTP
uniref:Trypsin inhibitor 3 n=1 Tax=Oncidium hybrid cultivar TaxID=141207 RepID=F5BCP8_ONCHC|nr:trypsin inhibitor 3 [Oncidium hybrid cultivar]